MISTRGLRPIVHLHTSAQPNSSARTVLQRGNCGVVLIHFPFASYPRSCTIPILQRKKRKHREAK